MSHPRKSVGFAWFAGVLVAVVSAANVVTAIDVDELGDPAEVVDVVGPIPSYQRDGFDTLDATFTAVIAFAEKMDGERELIFESGGGTVGFSLVYEAPSKLVLRAAGNGGFSLAVLHFALPDHLIGPELDLAWTFDVDDLGLQTIAILVSDTRVASLTMALQPDWTGSNDAAFGVQDSTVAANGENGGIPAVDFTSGTINLAEGLRFYSDANYLPEGTDTDGDGIADEWEMIYFPGQLDQLGAGDLDGDGLSDVEEFEFLADPTRADTDGDGLTDDEELAEATQLRNPDTDGDGLGDAQEIEGDPATDPLNRDTDGDGFSDLTERLLGSDPTDPGSIPPDCVSELGDPTEEPITVLGQYPDYQRNGYDTQDVTFTAVVDFEEKLEGEPELIWESGGGTVGFSLVYEATSRLVLRSNGNGGFSLATAAYELTADHLDDGDLDLAWAYDVDNGQGLQTISLFVNFIEVASVTMDLGGDWSGSNDASFGLDTSGVAGTGQNGTIDAVDFISGFINLEEGLNFYSDVFFCPETSDSDADGLPDEWEDLFAPGDLGRLGPGDADGDGLADVDEFEAGTNPLSRDTDGDGLEDDEEIALGTNPVVADTDSDGLTDAEEVNGDPPTDPTLADTDGDGFTDDREIARGTDPNDPLDVIPECSPDLGEPTEPAITEFGRYPAYQREGYDRLDVTFTAVIDFEPKPEGERELIWESGGSGNGFSLVYEAVDTLVLRASGAGTTLAMVRYRLPESLIDEGEVDLAWAYDVDDAQGFQTISLFINGVEVASATVDLEFGGVGDWTGGNDASFGVETTGFAGTGTGSNLRGIDFISGTINLDEGLNFYSDVFYCPESTDSDGDGLADEWESLFAPGDLGRLGDGDADGDGLSDAEEFELGTHPLNEDSDDDGLADGAEVTMGTDPFVADSDGDGRSDGDEVNGDPATDPTNPDTDGDGFPDGPEVAAGTDPTDSESLPAQECDEEPDNLVEVIDILGPLPSYDSRLPLDPFDPDPANLDQRDATFITSIDFDPKTGGEREVIWETGGGTTGFSLVYEATSTLVLRANGSGGFVLVTVAYELPDELIAGGEVTIAWTYDVEHAGLSTISLIVNDVVVGSGSADLGGDWSGTNAAAFGVADTGFAGTGQNGDLTGVNFTSGTISLDVGLEFYSEVVWCPGGAPLPSPRLKPGDVNGDASFNIADMVAQLNFLFGGGALPECYVVPGSDPVALNATGLRILDYNGDGSSNIADAVGGLNGLFGGGAPHALGEGCAEIEGSCESSCVD